MLIVNNNAKLVAAIEQIDCDRCVISLLYYYVDKPVRRLIGRNDTAMMTIYMCILKKILILRERERERDAGYMPV